MAERFEPMVRGHAERLIPQIDDLMAQSGVDHSAIDLVAVATGPGTFTGLRIGLAAARGIALAIGRPCLGISSFEVSLHDAHAAATAAWARDEAVLVVLDSRRSEYFVQAFLAPHGAAMAPVVAPPVQAADGVAAPIGLIVGTAAAVAGDALRASGLCGRLAVQEALPRASAVARIARRRWETGSCPARPPDPTYLRAPDTGAKAPL